MPSWQGSYDKVGHSQLMKAVLFSIFFMLNVVVSWLTSYATVSKTTAHNFSFTWLSETELLLKLQSVWLTPCDLNMASTQSCVTARGAQREKIHSITPTLLSITRLWEKCQRRQVYHDVNAVMWLQFSGGNCCRLFYWLSRALSQNPFSCLYIGIILRHHRLVAIAKAVPKEAIPGCITASSVRAFQISPLLTIILP